MIWVRDDYHWVLENPCQKRLYNAVDQKATKRSWRGEPLSEVHIAVINDLKENFKIKQLGHNPTDRITYASIKTGHRKSQNIYLFDDKIIIMNKSDYMRRLTYESYSAEKVTAALNSEGR